MGLEQKLVTFIIFLAFYFINHKPHLGYPEESYRTVISKILPVATLLGIVLTSKISTEFGEKIHEARKDYKKFIGIGLFFSMFGDACLVWRHQFFIPGVLFFAVAQMSYLRAFKLDPFGPLGVFLVFYGSALGLYAWFWVSIDDSILSLLVAIYTVLILGMAWRSFVELRLTGTLRSVFACFGAFAFTFSDLIIAVDKWKFEVDNASALVMISYYAAQFGLAMSVAVSS
ncbi:unnamed protein product [Owenia fusiformis]|uniref:lysoplasmalogenase n=1 Tax=Owenia fusiformis TaxID=6347 RepID=A0A8S4PE41_OWEFU|nr:unnamed protein product [Owenia fusiformis]